MIIELALVRNKKEAKQIVKRFNSIRNKYGNVGFSNAWYSKGFDNYGTYYLVCYNQYYPCDTKALNKAETKALQINHKQNHPPI